LLAVSDLSKRYGDRLALDKVSFQIHRGEVVAFLGPNGAGKTTALRILAGYLPKSGGNVCIGGVSLDSDDAEQARGMVGYLPEAVPLHEEMHVVEFLRFRAELKASYRESSKRGRRSDTRDEVERVADLTRVSDRMHSTIGKLSKGYRQRVGLADAMLWSPPVLLLDEPTSGLDPNQLKQMREVLTQLATEHAILLSTHLLAEAEAVCTRALVLSHGRLAGDVANLRGDAMTTANAKLTMQLKVIASETTQVIAWLKEVTSVQDAVLERHVDEPDRSQPGNVVHLIVHSRNDVDATAFAVALSQCCKKHGLPLVQLSPHALSTRGATRGSLEDLFSRIVGDGVSANKTGEAS
jgi:ABC-type multidrug transport system ATPase subunit